MRLKVKRSQGQKRMAHIFIKYGAPKEILSPAGGYSPYGTESDNDLFDIAMGMITRYKQEYVELVYQGGVRL